MPTHQAITWLSSNSKWSFGLLLTLLLFYIATIRNGHHWGDDYALYIHHAKNIASGVAYADVGYIADPDYPSYSVRMAPPVFPLILAFIYKIFGMNFTAFKFVEILFLLGALVLILALLRDYLLLPYRLLLIAIIGLNPFFWGAKDDVLSDLPFCFFVLLSALLIERRSHPFLWGLIAYLAVGTRTVGVVLLPAIITYELVRYKRMTKYLGIAIGTSTTLVALQRMVLHGDAVSSYWDMFRPTLEAYILNFRNYPIVFGKFWLTPVFGLALLIYCAMIFLALKGIRGEQPLFLVLFNSFYGITLLAWPINQGCRYLIPIFVLFLFYAIRGMQRLSNASCAAVCMLVLAGYMLQYRGENFRTINEANGRETFMSMCAWVTSNTTPEERIVFNRARALSLFTGRAASPYHQTQNTEALWEYFHSQNITYVIVSSIFEKDRLVLGRLIEIHKTELDLRYQNPEFLIYAIN